MSEIVEFIAGVIAGFNLVMSIWFIIHMFKNHFK